MSIISPGVKTAPLKARIFQELEQKTRLALRRYASVHRGAGQHAQISTRLYERARKIVLDYLELDGNDYCAIFGTRRSLSRLNRSIRSPEPVYQLFSNDLGLPLGIGVIAARKSALPRGVPDQRGGGTVNLVSRNYVIWKEAPEKFEAGTPNIIGAIMLAVALQLIKKYGDIGIFQQKDASTSAFQLLYADNLNVYSKPELLEQLGQSAIGRGEPVPTSEGLLPFVDFDSAATTPTLQAIWDVACQTVRQPKAMQGEVVPLVESICSKFFQIPLDEYEILFVSNSTEGINIIAESLRQRGRSRENIQPTVLTTGLEHNSNDLSWQYVPGISVLRLSVDDEGFIRQQQLEEMLFAYNQESRFGNRRIRLVAVSGCSNVVGAMNNLRNMSAIVHRYGAVLLVDAAQLAAHRQIAMIDAGIDILVCSGHKMYAPFGAGLLIVRKGLLKLPADEMDEIRASGRENAVGIAALGKAISLLSRVGVDTIQLWERELTRRAIQGLQRIPGVQIYGVSEVDSERFAHRGPVLAFSLKHVPHNLIAKMLAELGGIGVRSGCFCAHLFVKQLMGISPFRSFAANVAMLLSPSQIKEMLPGIVRASFSFLNTAEEIDHFLRTLERIASTPTPPINRLFARFCNGTPRLPVTAGQRRTEALIDTVERRVYGGD
ncbi:MAG: aminotransferase class V-fold PLP-dependent enzyme [Spirochaetaceae bacterium]|nr:MAG: aminotransferase class V-fold PLP-dependent enzyme [Spirochaetaceae bacterium]